MTWWQRFVQTVLDFFTAPVDGDDFYAEIPGEDQNLLTDGSAETEATEVEVVEEASASLPMLEPDGGRQVTAVRPLRLCLDFGTSACAVAWPRGLDGQLARLVVASREPRTFRHTIDSVLAVHRDPDEPAVLGAPARRLRDQAAPDPRFRYYRSLKRLLADGRRQGKGAGQLAHPLEKVVEELVTLALTPKGSGTIREELAIFELEDDDYCEGLGIEGFPVDAIRTQGLELRLTVPNAFGAYECELLQHASHAGLRRFLESLFAARGWGHFDQAVPVPSLVREADAVVWWELARWRGSNPRASTLPPSRLLVFDVGGGSTDAALVSAEIDEGLPRVAIERHSGVTVGGNDVDELLVRCLADLREGRLDERIAEVVSDIAGTGRENRRGALGQVSPAKIDWSTELSRVLSEARNQGDVLAESWAIWLAQALLPGSPESISAGELDFQAYGLKALPPVPHSAWGPRLTKFLRATICTVVDDLFPPGEDHGTIDRVVVSGRGALLPGLREALAVYLVERGLVRTSDAVDFTTAANEDDVDHMKLACVRGACASTTSAGTAVGHFVGQEITYRLEMRPETRVWRAGTRLIPGGQARAVVRLPRVGRDARVQFAQRRFPTSVDAWFGDSDSWTSRTIATLDVPLASECSLLARFDAARWRLGLWQLVEGGEPIPLPEAPDDEGPAPRSPITGLPFGWGDLL
ncbi:MAG TPA: hypothetical protein QGF58_10135 [Myxococcota bacterium]|nr:hypothetical protein [Myxococcota bacterium]